jgi:hypothetical protein
MIGRLPSVRNILISAIPFVICEIAGLSFFIFPAEVRFNIIKWKIEFQVAYYPFMVFMLAYFSYYVYNSYKSLQNYKISLLQIYSYRENVDLLWLRRLVVLFSSITIIVFPTGLVSYFYFHSIVFADYLFYLTLVIASYLTEICQSEHCLVDCCDLRFRFKTEGLRNRMIRLSIFSFIV